MAKFALVEDNMDMNFNLLVSIDTKKKRATTTKLDNFLFAVWSNDLAESTGARISKIQGAEMEHSSKLPPRIEISWLIGDEYTCPSLYSLSYPTSRSEPHRRRTGSLRKDFSKHTYTPSWHGATRRLFLTHERPCHAGMDPSVY